MGIFSREGNLMVAPAPPKGWCKFTDALCAKPPPSVSLWLFCFIRFCSEASGGCHLSCLPCPHVSPLAISQQALMHHTLAPVTVSPLEKERDLRDWNCEGNARSVLGGWSRAPPPSPLSTREGGWFQAQWESSFEGRCTWATRHRFTLVEGVPVVFQRKWGGVNIKAEFSNREPSGPTGLIS